MALMAQQGFLQMVQRGAVMVRMAPHSGGWWWENGYGWKSLFFRCCRCRSGCSCRELWANFCVPVNICGGARGHWKAPRVGNCETVLRIQNLVKSQSNGFDYEISYFLSGSIRNKSWKERQICWLWIGSWPHGQAFLFSCDMNYSHDAWGRIFGGFD